MNNKENRPSGRRGIFYRALGVYVDICVKYFYYRRLYSVDRKNVPTDGPLLVVCNHQNGLNDALALLCGTPVRNKRKMRFIARADVFRPGLKKALDWLGIFPAFRASEGAASLANNYKTFSAAADELICNGTVAIYPEAGHQDGHWLGRFWLGFLRIVFEAAEKTNFERDFPIIPACNHYSNYYHVREEAMIKFGEPLSIKPYYEEYKENPRAAQQKISDELRRRVSELMLDITDRDNYKKIDFLRKTYGIGYAKANGLRPRRLPEKLEADKMLFAGLEAAKEREPERVQAVYDETEELCAETGRLNVKPLRNFVKNPSFAEVFFKGVGLLLLFPPFLVSCIVGLPVKYLPKILINKVKDRMLHSGINLAFTILITAPVLYLIIFGLVWIFTWWLPALITFVLLPFMGMLYFCYVKWIIRWQGKMRFRMLRRQGKLDRSLELYGTISRSLDDILGVGH